MTSSEYFARPLNRQLHNLLDFGKPTPGLTSVLGMGLNFCIKKPLPTNIIKNTFDRLRRDVRRINFWYNNVSDDSDYNPKLYISRHKWFDRAPLPVEMGIDNFEAEYLQLSKRRYNRPTTPNISQAKLQLAAQQKENDHTIVVPADKNLGPCILDRERYITRAMEEHLGDEDTYAIISDKAADSMMDLLRRALELWISKYNEDLTMGDRVYLRTARNIAPNKLAKFRMSMKVHKSPWKTRPIVCCVGTWMNNWSKWLDYYLRKLTPFIPTYTRDTGTVIDFIRTIKDLPPNAKLFTADADSMYTNIDTTHAIQVIGDWLESIKDDPAFPKKWPFEAIKEAMGIIMRFNIFEFGNLKIHQLRGTAMGTSSACIWATIYFAVHENNCLLPKYGKHLYGRKLLRFIDDIWAIWIFEQGESQATSQPWHDFKRDLQTFGRLRWTITEPSSHAVFLDLNIRIVGTQVESSTYQKDLNLYLYLPGSSAHTTGMIKGTIYGQLYRYFEHNSRYSDYIKFAVLLFQRLLARGHRESNIKPIFIEAHKRILDRRRTPNETNTQADSGTPLFLHFEYHPRDVPRTEIRRLYNKHLGQIAEDYLGVAPPIVAYSRPQNLGEVTSQAKLYEAPGRDAATHLAEYSLRRGLAPRPTGIRYLPTVAPRVLTNTGGQR